jgi:hypothetical protein
MFQIRWLLRTPQANTRWHDASPPTVIQDGVAHVPQSEVM